MGGPPIAFKTLTFLINPILRKLAFYAPLPHFENSCLLQLPIAAMGPVLRRIADGAGWSPSARVRNYRSLQSKAGAIRAAGHTRQPHDSCSQAARQRAN